jgi:uncharacterized membrane protein (DUF2068 family)
MTTEQTPAASAVTKERMRLEALRSISLLECAKGGFVMAAALSLYWFDPSDVADAFVSFLHRNPDGHFARLLFEWADKLSNVKVWQVVAGASCYSGLRFLEAYGLWRARPWAEWVALISGLPYLPVEIRLLIRRPSLLHAGILVVNVAIVLFMFYLRIYVPNRDRLKKADKISPDASNR